MKLDSIIGCKVENGMATFFAKDMNEINFHGSNFETSVRPGTCGLKVFSVKTPPTLGSGIVAMTVLVCDKERGHTISRQHVIVELYEESVELHDVYLPPAGKFCHVEDGRLVAKIAGDWVVSAKPKPDELQADPTILCKWILAEINDEEISLHVKGFDTKSAQERVVELEEHIVLLVRQINEFKHDVIDGARREEKLEREKVAANVAYSETLEILTTERSRIRELEGWAQNVFTENQLLLGQRSGILNELLRLNILGGELFSGAALKKAIYRLSLDVKCLASGKELHYDPQGTKPGFGFQKNSQIRPFTTKYQNHP